SLLLKNCIVGQKRTGKSKQFVLIEGDYAIKGPYTNRRLEHVTVRSRIFKNWSTPCVVNFFDVVDEKYVRFPNIMKEYKLEFENYKESFSDYTYNILKNSPVFDVKKAIENKLKFNDVSIKDLLLGLCHCNILGIGDMNLR